MMTKEERELIQAAQEGDQEAFEELVRRHEKQVYGLALRVCGNPQDAAEAAQEAFLSAWQGLRFFRQESEFSTWLYRLTSNAAIDLLRREKRHRGAASLDDELSPEAPDRTSLTPQDALEQKELGELIQKGLNDLSADHRQVLVLREMYQMSYQEISDVLDLDVGTVKSRISRGRQQLRKFLLKRGNFFHRQPSKETEKKEEGCP